MPYQKEDLVYKKEDFCKRYYVSYSTYSHVEILTCDIFKSWDAPPFSHFAALPACTSLPCSDLPCSHPRTFPTPTLPVKLLAAPYPAPIYIHLSTLFASRPAPCLASCSPTCCSHPAARRGPHLALLALPTTFLLDFHLEPVLLLEVDTKDLGFPGSSTNNRAPTYGHAFFAPLFLSYHTCHLCGSTGTHPNLARALSQESHYCPDELVVIA